MCINWKGINRAGKICLYPMECKRADTSSEPSVWTSTPVRPLLKRDWSILGDNRKKAKADLNIGSLSVSPPRKREFRSWRAYSPPATSNLQDPNPLWNTCGKKAPVLKVPSSSMALSLAEKKVAIGTALKELQSKESWKMSPLMCMSVITTLCDALEWILCSPWRWNGQLRSITASQVLASLERLGQMQDYPLTPSRLPPNSGTDTVVRTMLSSTSSGVQLESNISLDGSTDIQCAWKPKAQGLFLKLLRYGLPAICIQIFGILLWMTQQRMPSKEG